MILGDTSRHCRSGPALSHSAFHEHTRIIPHEWTDPSRSTPRLQPSEVNLNYLDTSLALLAFNAAATLTLWLKVARFFTHKAFEALHH